MTTHVVPDSTSAARRLEAAGWGLLLLMTGVLMLFPRNFVPEGTWLILAGVILLAVSAARYLNRIPVSAFVVALGILAIVAGGAAMAGLNLPLFAAFLIVAGASITLRPWFGRRET